MLRYNDAEYTVVALAASRASMTPTGYAAQVALDAARGAARTPDADREGLLELMRAGLNFAATATTSTRPPAF